MSQVALVTGATRGIGKAIALALGNMDMTVLGTATTDSGAEKITKNLAAAGVNGRGFQLDVCDKEAISQVLKAITEEFSAPTVLVNNAGITRDNLMLRMKEDEWDAVMNTNLNAIFHLTKACIKPMIKARAGRIINISSVVGAMGNPGQVNYVSAKAGLIGFTKALAKEIASRNVTVNAVAPGFIETDMTNALTDDQKQAINVQIPMKRMGAPEDIANAVAFLCGEGAAYITGQTLHVNGGMHCAG